MSVPATWLLLDCGNSAVKWALADAAADPAAGAAPPFLHHGRELLDGPDWVGRLRRALHATRASVAAAFGCSVAAPPVAQAIDEVARDLFAVAPAWRAAATGFRGAGVALDSGYRNPAQLGADRWHALIAARVAFPDQPLLIVNAGTATTVDAVTAAGRFEGGVIAPGVGLMLESLARGTARLPAARGSWSEVPDNTDDAIATGVLEAQVGLIERRLRRFVAAAGSPVRLLLSGGHAPALLPHLDGRLPAGALSAPVSIEDNLVLRGVLWRARAEAAGH